MCTTVTRNYPSTKLGYSDGRAIDGKLVTHSTREIIAESSQGLSGNIWNTQWQAIAIISYGLGYYDYSDSEDVFHYLDCVQMMGEPRSLC